MEFMYSHLMFDFDGTLVDTLQGIYAVFCQVSRDVGLEEKSFEEFRVHVGKTWEGVLTGLWPGIDLEQFSGTYDASGEEPKPIPGVGEAIIALSRDFNLSVLTSRGEKTLYEQFNLVGVGPEVFAHIFSRDDTSFHKPDPRVFGEVLPLVGEKPENVLYLGDSLIDLECAFGAGLGFLGVLTGGARAGDFRDAGADYIDSVAALPDYLNALKK